MCLILTGSSAEIRSTLLNTKFMLADIYDANADGLGIMYKNKRGLKVVKVLPSTLREVTEFIDRLPQDDRPMAMHWRMKTHGKIDLTNCHPYDVGTKGQLAYMHNGILATGNASDATKSDTWHFARDFLDEAADAGTDVFHTAGFLNLVGEYIGDNRFVFMDDQGRMSIVNKEQGIEHGGLWFSNTYAWEPSRLIPGYRSKYAALGGWAGAWDYENSRWKDFDDDADWDKYYARRNGTTPSLATSSKQVKGMGINDDVGRDFAEAVNTSDQKAAQAILNGHPYSALSFLFNRFAPKRTSQSINADTTAIAVEIIKAVEDAGQLATLTLGETGLYNMAVKYPGTLADILCYDFTWSIRLGPTGKIAGQLAVVPAVERAADVDADDADTDYDEVEELPGMDDDGPGSVDPSHQDFYYEYRGHQLYVYFDDHVRSWGYTTTGKTGSTVDNGFGYDDARQAARWAEGELDSLITKLQADAQAQSAKETA